MARFYREITTHRDKEQVFFLPGLGSWDPNWQFLGQVMQCPLPMMGTFCPPAPPGTAWFLGRAGQGSLSRAELKFPIPGRMSLAEVPVPFSDSIQEWKESRMDLHMVSRRVEDT